MKYEEIFVGQKESLSHKVTQSDIEKFVDLSGDDNKLHVNKEFAAKTSFKKLELFYRTGRESARASLPSGSPCADRSSHTDFKSKRLI